jgi:hypothetical protein
MRALSWLLTPLPTSPRGAVPDSALGKPLLHTEPDTLPLAGRVGEGVNHGHPPLNDEGPVR